MNVRKAAKAVASLTLAGALFGWSSAAHANVIAFGLQEAGVTGVSINGAAPTCNGGAVSAGGLCQVEYTGAGGTISFPGSGNNAQFGNFNISMYAIGTPPLATPTLETGTAVVTSAGAGTINVFVTEQGIVSPSGVFLGASGFTSNLQSQGLTVTEATYVDQQDYLFNTQHLLSSATFNYTGVTQSVTDFANTPNLLPVWSITAEYTITATAAGQYANLTINYADVPEPSSLLMLGSALLAMGGLLWFWRRKGAKA